ncbi:hypothetical protein [Furfurilactobacillus milii]|uniref:TPM domain-containing protein n=1 Tax=Furfurilactobacillus milii TaxID=2888272 RepID=A0A6N9I3L9_9LACO|nr:hypothetical protein [Furfurilactobacillus milii]MYV17560.1 hypothetical protein [Furfurilactobacillus milii]
MKSILKQLFLLILSTSFILIVFSTNAYAFGNGTIDLPGPNLGKYIYEQHETLTVDQYNHIVSINHQLEHAKNPQNLYVVIVDHIPQYYQPDSKGDVEPPDIGHYFGSSFLGQFIPESQNEDYAETTRAQSAENRSSLLIIATKDHEVGMVSSEIGYSYFTDYRFWTLRLGLNSSLKGSGDGQISALMTLFDRVSVKEKWMANSKSSEVKESPTWDDIQNRIIDAFVVLLIILLAFRLWTHRGGRNGGNFNTDGGNGYWDGYYDGYYNEEQNDHHNNLF